MNGSLMGLNMDQLVLSVFITKLLNSVRILPVRMQHGRQAMKLTLTLLNEGAGTNPEAKPFNVWPGRIRNS